MLGPLVLRETPAQQAHRVRGEMMVQSAPTARPVPKAIPALRDLPDPKARPAPLEMWGLLVPKEFPVIPVRKAR